MKLAAGTGYQAVRRADGGYEGSSDSRKPWRLIVHRNGEELLIR